VSPRSARRSRAPDGARLRVLRVRLSDAEAAEVERAERIVRGAGVGIEELVGIAREKGIDLVEAKAVLEAIRQAADAVVAMGRAASEP